MSQTISEIYKKIIENIVGKAYTLPITKNKGGPGQFLEHLVGIAHTSNCLDCSDGELKAFPVKKLQNGKLSPKETVAVTMLSKDELLINDFNSSKCCKKMTKILFVPYLRNGDDICFLMPTIIDKNNLEFADLYAVIESDYNLIRQNYIEYGVLGSKDGILLQNRTKGSKGSTSRAFYLRSEFIKQYIPISL